MANQPELSPPEGMEPYDLGDDSDLGGLSKHQQENLNKFKVKTRSENERYLRSHPEVECLLSGLLGEVLLKRPDNIREFAADYFTDPDLPRRVQKQLEERKELMTQNKMLQKI